MAVELLGDRSLEKVLNLNTHVQDALGEIATIGCVDVPAAPRKSAFMTAAPIENRKDRFTLYGEHIGSDVTVSTTHGLQYVPPAEPGAPDSYIAHPLNDKSLQVIITDPKQVAAIKKLRAAHDLIQKKFDDSNPDYPLI